MGALLPLAAATIGELFACYDPIALQQEDFVQFAMDQFEKRERRLIGGSPCTRSTLGVLDRDALVVVHRGLTA